MVVKTSRIPAPGETVIGGNFFMNQGGKGANQAVAAARLGGSVVFVARTGDDIFGRTAVEELRKAGMDTRYMITDPNASSGVALITVDEYGENAITVASGANARLSITDLEPLEHLIREASVVLMQLEVPLEVVEFVASVAQRHLRPFILNPAPGCTLSTSLLEKISILVPNSKEAELLSGVRASGRQEAIDAASKMKQQGVGTVIVTMGANGAILVDDEGSHFIEPVKVKAVDTTAAGDVFCGALAVSLAEGNSAKIAARFASRAAAISVTRMGAQASAPYRSELE